MVGDNIVIVMVMAMMTSREVEVSLNCMYVYSLGADKSSSRVLEGNYYILSKIHGQGIFSQVAQSL